MLKSLHRGPKGGVRMDPPPPPPLDPPLGSGFNLAEWPSGTFPMGELSKCHTGTKEPGNTPLSKQSWSLPLHTSYAERILPLLGDWQHARQNLPEVLRKFTPDVSYEIRHGGRDLPTLLIFSKDICFLRNGDGKSAKNSMDKCGHVGACVGPYTQVDSTVTRYVYPC